MRFGSRFRLIAFGFAVLAAGSLPANTNAQEPAAETASIAGSDTEQSERQRRREERRDERQQRREARADAVDAAASSIDPSEQAENAGAFVVYVEPEIECRRVQVSGSRMPKQVCTEVSRQAATEEYQEEQAREFLRRVQERALTNPPDPNVQEQNSAGLPGF